MPPAPPALAVCPVARCQSRAAAGRAKLDELCAAIGETDAASGEGLQRQDVMILRSMPGIGRINLAACSAKALGLSSSRDYPALRTLCGAAPVTKRSGKSQIVIMRYAAHARLRRRCIIGPRRHPARSKSRGRYAALRRRGHSHGRALRGVADRLLGLACVLLQRQTLFDPHFGQAG